MKSVNSSSYFFSRFLLSLWPAPTRDEVETEAFYGFYFTHFIICIFSISMFLNYKLFYHRMQTARIFKIKCVYAHIFTSMYNSTSTVT